MAANSELIQEFREALEAEIEAAKQDATARAVPLVDGRRIGKVVLGFQYVFRVESALQLPDDSPADLLVGGKTMPADIVSIEGMRVTLRVGEDLGSFVPRARLQTDLTLLLRRLIERLQDLEGSENPTGQRILGELPPSGRPKDTIHSPGLNSEQRAAVESSLGRDTTFIWGPPGTGKTRTIGALGQELYKAGRSVLLVSHTNTAVDEAILQVADNLGPELEDGSVLRVGNPKLAKLRDHKPRLLAETHIDERASELASDRDALIAEQESMAIQANDLERRIVWAEWVAEAPEDIARLDASLANLALLEAQAEEAALASDDLATQEKRWTVARNAAERDIELENEVDHLEEALRRIISKDKEIGRRVQTARAELETAEDLLHQIQATNPIMRRWRRLPSLDVQSIEVQTRAEHLQELKHQRVQVSDEEQAAQPELILARSRLAEFERIFGAGPEEIRSQSQDYLRECVQALDRRSRLAGNAAKARDALTFEAVEKIEALKEWGLDVETVATAEDGVAEIRRLHQLAQVAVPSEALDSLKTEADRLRSRLAEVASEVAIIEDRLEKVEEVVVGDAVVVATTLTRAYLRDSILKRRFDTVVLDEASMAPIPALWAAAALADNAVVVGDHRQLPPIQRANHPLAIEWLGKDIFEKSGVIDRRPDWFMSLRIQYRMHPEISAIVNKLVYQEAPLQDAKGTTDEAELFDWYVRGSYDRPVLLLDTEPLNAWVTSVAGRGSSSRLNFLSAAAAVNLADQLLRKGRAEAEADRQRVLIICPYTPQARLLDLLIREQDLEPDVRAVTIHQAQGAEASVVIYDFVNDEPHWRVGMFNAAYDNTTLRLLNVALTRARRRMFLIGDFAWMRKQTKEGAFLHRLVDFLVDQYPIVDVRDVVLRDIASQAARFQASPVFGSVERKSQRMVVTQDDFYTTLLQDLQEAKHRVVIYSPFMTKDRVGYLQSALRSAVDRGVKVYVITKTRSERKRNEVASATAIENVLTDWGVFVIHKHHMHEKLVFVDDSVLWSGSLNPLSFSSTQEVMERRESTEVVDSYAKTLRLEDLVGLYDRGEDACPICQSEIIPAEGRADPFYWRCIEKDCYSRSIDQPNPVGGRIVCSSCGEAVEFGEWGGAPSWRCIVNRRHRQKVARSHLQLPRMREAIPKAELTSLEARFGISSSDVKDIPRKTKKSASDRSHTATRVQRRLDFGASTLQQEFPDSLPQRSSPTASEEAGEPTGSSTFRDGSSDQAEKSQGRAPVEQVEEEIDPRTNLVGFLEVEGIELLDLRESGRQLWIFGGTELEDLVSKLAAMGIRFGHNPSGRSYTGDRGGWATHFEE